MKVNRKHKRTSRITNKLVQMIGSSANFLLLNQKIPANNISSTSITPNNYGFTMIFAAIILSFALTGCIKTTENRGYVVAFSDFSKIRSGSTSKEEALAILGSPSSRSNLDGEKWYYIGMIISKATLSSHEVVNQDIVVISFSESGLVSNIERKSKKDRRKIAISDESTPTEGNAIGVIEQLLGNMGKFNPAQ